MCQAEKRGPCNRFESCQVRKVASLLTEPLIRPRLCAGPRGVRSSSPRDTRKLPGRVKTEVLRLLLIEDHAAFRGTLAFMLNLRPGMRVVAQYGSLTECRALGSLLGAIDVALLDLMLPDGDGTAVIWVLRGANPSVKALILTASIAPGLRSAER